MTENQEHIDLTDRLHKEAIDIKCPTGGAPVGRMALVALPWSQKDRPSAAIAALAAYIRRERPGWDVACCHTFVPLAAQIGFDLYDMFANNAYTAGELLNLSLLYPEKTAAVRQQFETWATEALTPEFLRTLEPVAHAWGEVFDRVRVSLDDHLNALLATVSTGLDAVGLTTCFGQLFVNLAFAQRLKERAPDTKVILGGSTVSARVGPSLLAEYPFVDYIVQGEGEGPLVALLDVLVAQPAVNLNIEGVLAQPRNGAPCVESTISELRNLDELPFPDYDEYADLAEEYGISWALPLEASRGCWWDRTKRAENPKAVCYFCNLNIQWGGYRQKSVQRVASEIDELSQRYQNLRLFFLDNILRAQGVPEFAEAIAQQQKDYHIFYEMRASVRPYEMLLLWEAGLRETQFGIEGFSMSLLRRIGKGTTTIQNLQAMRLCHELGINNMANLIVDFPGSTQEEVEETRRNLLDYAWSFQPLNVTKFFLGVGSTVDMLRESFGVVRVRNKELYKAGLPEGVWNRLQLFDLDFDVQGEPADWTPVREACETWRAAHAHRKPLLLFYQDGGSFLNIIDDREEERREGTFEGLAREIYLYCMEIRSLAQIRRQFGVAEAELLEMLEMFVADRIMFAEQGKYLSLAVALNPWTAARRIRAAHADAERDGDPPSQGVIEQRNRIR
jgi:ribosomal peptide maturation radical SAM protein 1